MKMFIRFRVNWGGRALEGIRPGWAHLPQVHMARNRQPSQAAPDRRQFDPASIPGPGWARAEAYRAGVLRACGMRLDVWVAGQGAPLGAEPLCSALRSASPQCAACRRWRLPAKMPPGDSLDVYRCRQIPELVYGARTVTYGERTVARVCSGLVFLTQPGKIALARALRKSGASLSPPKQSAVRAAWAGVPVIDARHLQAAVTGLADLIGSLGARHNGERREAGCVAPAAV
ncbi:MAG: hypothetical protein FJ399_01880, partial [Verrucomicrobia bacterium]|nr:hypothetical protein [Verrucomicrobiota bacterium]